MEMILSSLCYDMLNCQLIMPQFPLRYGVNPSIHCHYIMTVATANIITTTKDMLPMLQDMLPLPQLCPECQMLARVPASASATSATSATILGLLRPPANRGPGGSPPPMGGEAASWPPQPANHRPALTSPGWPGSFGLCCNLHLFSGHLHCSSCFLCFLKILKQFHGMTEFKIV